MPDDEAPIQTHFISIFRYIVGISTVVLLYVGAVTFLPIPKDNIRFVDISFGFLLNLLAQGINYLTGGNPSGAAKKESKNEVDKENTTGNNGAV